MYTAAFLGLSGLRQHRRDEPGTQGWARPRLAGGQSNTSIRCIRSIRLPQPATIRSIRLPQPAALLITVVIGQALLLLLLLHLRRCSHTDRQPTRKRLLGPALRVGLGIEGREGVGAARSRAVPCTNTRHTRLTMLRAPWCSLGSVSQSHGWRSKDAPPTPEGPDSRDGRNSQTDRLTDSQRRGRRRNRPLSRAPKRTSHPRRWTRPGLVAQAPPRPRQTPTPAYVADVGARCRPRQPSLVDH